MALLFLLSHGALPENESPVETPRSPCSSCQYQGQTLPSLSIRFQPTSDSSPSSGVAQLENKPMCVQVLGPGDLSSNTKYLCISMRESPQHTESKRKRRACACWSKVKPQNEAFLERLKVKPRKTRELSAGLFWRKQE